MTSGTSMFEIDIDDPWDDDDIEGLFDYGGLDEFEIEQRYAKRELDEKDTTGSQK